MTPPLKPCPFCGGKAHLGHTASGYLVECDNPQCRMMPWGFRLRRAEIVRYWNERVPEGVTKPKRVGTRSKASGGTTTG